MQDHAAEVPIVRSYLERAIALARGTAQGITVREDDDFGFMVMNFLNRQIDHGESLLLLAPRRDASLIARAMFDGLVQLLWAYHQPHERGRQWRSFIWVHDWRTMQARLKAGQTIDQEDRDRIDSGLARFGSTFQKKTSRQVSSADPCHRSWRAGVNLSDMAIAVRGKDMYDSLYAELSDWEHWGPGGFGDSIDREGDRITFTAVSERACLQAFVFAFQSVIQTLEAASAYLHLACEPQVHALRDSFVARVGAG